MNEGWSGAQLKRRRWVQETFGVRTRRVSSPFVTEDTLAALCPIESGGSAVRSGNDDVEAGRELAGKAIRACGPNMHESD